MKRMKNKVYLYLVLLACIGTCSSCITKKDTTYLQRSKKAMYSPAPKQEYRLRVNDEISYVLMSSNPETQSYYNGRVGGVAAYTVGNEGLNSFRIYNDGTVHLPIGQIRIEGLTLREAEGVIRNAFSAIVLDAEIKLSLVNNHFYVQGGNGGNGQFPIYKENLNIFQALALAGDISKFGNKKKIHLIRKGPDGLDHVKIFDLTQESIIESEFYYVMPNDVFYIPTSPKSFFRVDSVTSFMSLIVTPISFLVSILNIYLMFKK